MAEVKYRETFRWRDDPLYESRSKPKIVYDDIVDDTDFKHLKEQNRLTRLSQEGAGAGQGQGVYDFDGSKKSKEDFDKVSDAVVALREGRLDKSDVDVLKKQFEAQAESDLSKIESEKASKKAKEVSRKRQEFIDAQMGFNPPDNSVDAPNI